MPESNGLEQRTFKVMSRILKVPADQLTPETSPDTIAAWDSLQHMNLIVALEEEFGIQFAPERIVEMQSVELILAVLKEMGVH